MPYQPSIVEPPGQRAQRGRQAGQQVYERELLTARSRAVGNPPRAS